MYCMKNFVQFVLKKNDLEAVLEDYSDAKRILNARARKLINENAEENKKEMSARNNVIFERRRDQRHASIYFVIQNDASFEVVDII